MLLVQQFVLTVLACDATYVQTATSILAIMKDLTAKVSTLISKQVKDRKDIDKCLANLPKGWVPVMKIKSGSNVFGFSSKYWTDARTLNPNSAPSTNEDAKYAAFNTEKFTQIRMCLDGSSRPMARHRLKAARAHDVITRFDV